MPIIKANQINIYYEIHGSGKPLVLIAGLGYCHWMWSRMTPWLAQHFQAILFDNRGAGQTEKPAGPYTAQLLADDTALLLRSLGIEKAVVMGHSMGGFIAQAMALQYPEMISHLILSATNFGGPRHIPITPEAMAVLTDLSGDSMERFRRGLEVSTAPGFAEKNPQVIKEWIKYRVENPIEPMPYQAQMAIGLALLSEETSFENRLKQISSPVLILFGEHDQVVPVGNAQLLAKQIPNHRLHILENAGHFFPIEKPVEAVQAITEFIGSN